MAISFRLHIPTQSPENHYIESVQDVANYIFCRLKRVADELRALRCPTVFSANHGYELSGRIYFKDYRSFSDSHEQIVREAVLHLGSAALGNSLAMLVVGSLRKEISEYLMNMLPSGSAREEGALLIVEMNDEVLRLKPVLDPYRSAIHVRAKYTPKFYADV